MTQKDIGKAIIDNLISLIYQDKNTSMRSLGTCIGASDSYIEKIVSGKAKPSIDKLDDIGEYFEIGSWEILYNSNPELKPVLTRLKELSPELLPVMNAFLDYLLMQQEQKSKK